MVEQQPLNWPLQIGLNTVFFIKKIRVFLMKKSVVLEKSLFLSKKVSFSSNRLLLVEKSQFLSRKISFLQIRRKNVSSSKIISQPKPSFFSSNNSNNIPLKIETVDCLYIVNKFLLSEPHLNSPDTLKMHNKHKMS